MSFSRYRSLELAIFLFRVAILPVFEKQLIYNFDPLDCFDNNFAANTLRVTNMQ